MAGPVVEVAPGVVRIDAPLPYSSPAQINCYLLIDEDDVTLVDTGMLGSEAALDSALCAAGVQVDRVVLTHGHPDHWGLADRFGCPVLAHESAVGHMRFEDDPASEIAVALPGRAASPELIELMLSYRTSTLGVPEIEPIRDGDRLGDWVVVETPGHAPDHVCLFRERDRVLIAGDHLLPDVTPNINLSRAASDAVASYLGSLERTRALEARLVLPAHGEPFTDGARQCARMTDHHLRRLELIETTLRERDTDVSTLVRVVFGELADPHDRVLAEMELHAHLEYLRRRQRARVVAPATWSADQAPVESGAR